MRGVPIAHPSLKPFACENFYFFFFFCPSL
jgi:hypothetical protein